MMATLVGIAIKPAAAADMQTLSEGRLSIDAGVVGDCRGRPGPRQVTLLSQAAWREACNGLEMELDWTQRRANLLVDDLPLHNSRGAHIRLGEAVLEITGETDPCARMEAVHPGLFNALARDWRGGVTCRVLQGGPLTLGMEVCLDQGVLPKDDQGM